MTTNTLPRWTEDRTEALTEIVGSTQPVPYEVVVSAAEQLETTPRSVSSKLRKLGFEVESSTANTVKAYTDEQEATLRAFVEDNSGEYTYAQIAEAFEGGIFSPKSIQGKILSMELTEHVKPSPKPEAARKYTEAEEATFVQMAASGATVEDLAEAMGRSVNSIRGKALSLLRSGEITSIPRQANRVAAKEDSLEALGDITAMTVEAIAEAIGKTARGVKTMLTRRGLVAADYDGASKKEKAAA